MNLAEDLELEVAHAICVDEWRNTNNKMEKFNEVHDREKTRRGLKKNDTLILSGYQMFHNYFREHEGLNGKTPAEACGIKIEGKNKWLTLIQNASKNLKS